MKTKRKIYYFLFGIMLIPGISCERCYNCECYKQNQKFTEDFCEKGFSNTSRTSSAQQYEKSIEVKKGYDDCECY